MAMNADGPSEELQEVENELIDKKDVDLSPQELENGKIKEYEGRLKVLRLERDVSKFEDA
jgi:hypothetical protein